MNVFLIGILRVQDSAVITSYNYQDGYGPIVLKELLEDNNKDYPLIQDRRYSAEAEFYAVHYTIDSRRLLYAVVTNKQYPSRVAFSLLEELQQNFVENWEMQIPTAVEGSLNKKCKSMLRELCMKYDSPANVDRLLSVQSKVDAVRMTMQDNIQAALRNDEKLETLNTATEEMNKAAGQFKTRSHMLARKMWWQQKKLQLMLFAAVVLILLLVVTPAVAWYKKHHHK